MTVDEKLIVDISRRIHSNPELAFEEYASAELVASTLERAGFAVERGVAELPTAFRAIIGSGELNLAICAEYDALPGVGHACGHNIIAAAATGAALALAPKVDELGITLTVLGTPAEEGGGGKIFMLQRGAFDGVCAAMMVHPCVLERDGFSTLATSQLHVQYTGRAAHAAAAPERGRSASAALALAQSGIAMLREHIEADQRIHGIVTHGGDAPNVVPHHTEGRWFVRSATVAKKNALEARVIEVFKGAAMMTGCSVRIGRTAPGFSEVVTDQEMAAIWRDVAAGIGRKSLPCGVADDIGSTDMGNVSYAVPTIHPMLSLDSGEANIHEPEFEQFAGSATGDRAAIDGAHGMAQTIERIASNPVIRERLLAARYAIDDEDPAAPYLSNDWNRTVEFDGASPNG